MKVQVMSDIHQEFSNLPLIQKESITGDALLLAGDICMKPEQIAYMKDFQVPIYMVLGNHEYYKASWEGTVENFKQYFENTNIHVLEKDTHVVNGVRIIGATLWTDFWAPDKAGKEHQGKYCRQGMNDFYLIAGISVEKWEERHKQHLDYIKCIIENDRNIPTIVMTHHAPSYRSNHVIFANSLIRGGFCSDLDAFIENYEPTVWVHGHTHNSWDYTIGSTRVVCNPHGYYPHHLNLRFQQQFIITIGD